MSRLARPFVAVAIGIVICLSNAAAQPHYDEGNRSAQRQQTDQRANQSDPGVSDPAGQRPPQSKPEQRDTGDERHRANEERNWSVQNSIAIAQTLLGLFVFVTSIFTVVVAFKAFRATARQADEARAQTEIARHAFVVSNRAWLRPELTIAGPMSIGFEGGVRCSYTMKVRNSGIAHAHRTVLHNVELVSVTARSNDDPLDELERLRIDVSKEALDRGVMIDAGTTFDDERAIGRSISPAALRQQVIPTALPGEGTNVRLYLIGSIAYTFDSDADKMHSRASSIKSFQGTWASRSIGSRLPRTARSCTAQATSGWRRCSASIG